MGFFQDLKEDLTQAVNELMPEDLETEETKNTNDEEIVDEPNLENDKVESKQESEKSQEAGNEQDQEKEPEELEEELDLEKMLSHALGESEESDEIKEAKELEELERQLLELEEEQAKEEQAKEEQAKVEEQLAKEQQLEQKQLEAAIENIAEIPDEVVSDILKSEDTVEEALHKAVDQKKEKTNEKKEIRKMADNQTSTKLTGVASDETSIITAGMTITGDVASKGSVEVIGNIVGNVESLGKLDVTGSINGNSKAAEVYADCARITGEIHSEGTIKIGQSSVIIGNIFAKSAVIAGAVKGDIDVQGPVVLDTSAIVMGNIKSKSVQINNGAVIEGMCSQCYADVSPTSFFEDYK